MIQKSTRDMIIGIMEPAAGVEPTDGRLQGAPAPGATAGWYPRGDSNPSLLIENQPSWPLDDGG